MLRVLAFLALSLCLALPVHAGPPDGSTDAVNIVRRAVGLGKLKLNNRLQKAAEAHAGDLSRNDYFSHTGRNGSKVRDRARAKGYRHCWVSENIAKGQKTLEEVMRDWMASTGHRRNILNTKAEHYALARTPDNTWVMMLGADGC